MVVKHVNRKGQTFYLHEASTRTDKPRYSFSMKGEGAFEYEALLFIPSQAPFDLFTRDAKIGVQLYVKRVFVMGDCELRASTERQLFYGQERNYWSMNLETTLKVLEEWNSSDDATNAVAEASEAADLAGLRRRSA